jgi:uncharacterized membrane protein YtjA (UPF0391 family)
MSQMCRRERDSARQNRRRTRPAIRPGARSAFSRGTASSIGSYRVNGAAAAHRLMERTVTLLRWALIFFLVSIVAGVLGFTDISAASADVARFLFYVFVVTFLVLLILGLTIFRV